MSVKEEERKRYLETMERLRALERQGMNVAEELREERRRHHTAKARIYRKENPERTRAAVRKYRDAHLEERQKIEKKYGKEHPIAHARAMRRWNARRKILQEFMAIDEAIFE